VFPLVFCLLLSPPWKWIFNHSSCLTPSPTTWDTSSNHHLLSSRHFIRPATNLLVDQAMEGLVVINHCESYVWLDEGREGGENDPCLLSPSLFSQTKYAIGYFGKSMENNSIPSVFAWCSEKVI